MERKEFISLIGKGMIGGTALLTSCSKLLDLNNPNTLTPTNFWQSAGDAEANVTGIYQVFLGQASWSCADNWYNRMVAALYRGDDIGITHDVPDWWTLALFTTTDASAIVSGLWNLNYKGIFRANQAIDNIPGIAKMDADEKTRLIGEAKFMRGYFYFSLVTNYLNVPLILTVPKDSSEYAQAQAAPADTWSQIVKDFTDAAAALPATYDADNQGRVTQGAALGFLGKSYLYMGKWQEASDTFDRIIKSKTYSLLPDYADVFREDHDFSEESLLEVNYAKGSFKGQTLESPRNYEEAPSEAGGWYECYPNQFLMGELMKEKTLGGKLDPRMYATVIWKDGGLTYYGQTYEQLFGAGSNKVAWAKYNEWELGTHLSEYSGKNLRVLRYSDVLLMHAEALNNLGRTLEAVPFVNTVRTRAKLVPLIAGLSKAGMAKEIEHQRIIEFADEGTRFYDLQRWGTLKENLVAHGALGAANFIKGKNEYLPIPITELQANTKAKQNPHY
jgi:tetratricopeptide (TPR) repeat protein